MGFRFQKRINLGKSLGVNISKSGITPSYRTKSGSVSTKGYSVRTGVSGVTYRKTFSKAKNSGCLLIFIFLMLTGSVLTNTSCKNEITKSTNQWYHGGNLNKYKITDCKNADEINKLTTCGDFCANIYKDNSNYGIKRIVTNLKRCIDEAIRGNDAANRFVGISFFNNGMQRF